MKKRGISEVVAVVLVILLALALVAIAWAVISSMLQKSAHEAEVRASLLPVQYTFVKRSETIDNGNLKFHFQRRPGGGNITCAAFVLTADDGTKYSYFYEHGSVIPEFQTLEITIQKEIFEEKTITSIDVFSCFQEGDEKFTSDNPTDSYKFSLKSCSELGGVVCGSTESCPSNQKITAKEAKCCQPSQCIASPSCTDSDGDRYASESSGNCNGQCNGQSCLGYDDCADSNAAINPSASEVCGNSVDENCNSQIDEGCSSPLCTLSSATWSLPEIRLPDTTTISLNAAGTNCNDKQITYTIYEKDTPPNTDDEYASDTQALLSVEWNSLTYEPDADSGNGDPEYYFIVSPVENPTSTQTSAAIKMFLCTDADGDEWNSTSICNYDSSIDCDDSNPSIHLAQTWFKDYDNDNYPDNPSSTQTQCLRPTGYKLQSELISTSPDCNDNNPAINPGMTEVCYNPIDDNCNDQIDEGCVSQSVCAVSNLIHYWGMNDASVNTLADKKSGNNAAYRAGSCSLTTVDAKGGSKSLYCTTDYTSFEFNNQVSVSGQFTFAGWVKLEGTINEYDAMIGRSGQDFNFFQSRATFWASDSGASTNQIRSSAQSTTIWEFWALTRESTGTLRLYRNGVNVGETTAPPLDDYTSPGIWTGVFNPQYLGKGNLGGLRGRMDEFGIWNKALSAAEIQTLYNFQNGGGTCDTLIN